jgi:hypothetical protein
LRVDRYSNFIVAMWVDILCSFVSGQVQ